MTPDKTNHPDPVKLVEEFEAACRNLSTTQFSPSLPASVYKLAEEDFLRTRRALLAKFTRLSTDLEGHKNAMASMQSMILGEAEKAAPSPQGAATEIPAAPDLAKFGYAPGGYMNRCTRCEGQFLGEKRAWSCQPCALAKAEAPTPSETLTAPADRKELREQLAAEIFWHFPKDDSLEWKSAKGCDKVKHRECADKILAIVAPVASKWPLATDQGYREATGQAPEGEKAPAPVDPQAFAKTHDTLFAAIEAGIARVDDSDAGIQTLAAGAAGEVMRAFPKIVLRPAPPLKDTPPNTPEVQAAVFAALDELAKMEPEEFDRRINEAVGPLKDTPVEATGDAAVLWQIIDDIDTLSDMHKPEKSAYTEAVHRLVGKRFKIFSSDGYKIFKAAHTGKATAPGLEARKQILDLCWSAQMVSDPGKLAQGYLQIAKLLEAPTEAPGVTPARPMKLWAHIDRRDPNHITFSWDKCGPGQISDHSFADPIVKEIAYRINYFEAPPNPPEVRTAEGLDLDALEAYMQYAVSEKPDWPGLETAGLAWLDVIRRIKSKKQKPDEWTYFLTGMPPLGQKRSTNCDYCHRDLKEHNADNRCPIPNCTLSGPPEVRDGGKP